MDENSIKSELYRTQRRLQRINKIWGGNDLTKTIKAMNQWQNSVLKSMQPILPMLKEMSEHQLYLTNIAKRIEPYRGWKELLPIANKYQDRLRIATDVFSHSPEIFKALDAVTTFQNFPLNDLVDGGLTQEQVRDMLDSAVDETNKAAPPTVQEVENEIASQDNSSRDFLKLSSAVRDFLINLFLAYFIGLYFSQMSDQKLEEEQQKTRELIEYKHAESSREIKKILRNLNTLQKESIRNYRVVTTSGLHLRKSPGKKFQSLALLPSRTLVKVLDSQDRSWLLVEAEENGEIIIGWIYRSHTASPSVGK